MDPLLEAALRRKELEDLLKEDPAARTRRQFRQYLEDTNTGPGYFGEPRASRRRREGARHAIFRQYDLAERYAKQAETSGVLDLLTLHPALKTGQALRAGSFGNAAVNALAFTSQFGDDPVSRLVGEVAAFTPNLSGLGKMSKAARSAEFQKRLGQDYLVGGTVGAGLTLGGMAPQRETDENTAAFPVFGGVGTLGNLRRVAQRAAAKGKDLPQFDFEGKIAPRRQQELEQRMRAWIPKLSGKDPEGTTKKLDAWVKNNPFWGKYPLEKGPLLDLMPAELRQPFYQSLKEMGYGGTRMGERTALGSRGEKLGGRARNENFSEIPSFANRKWEDILKFEQGGGLPAGWAAANPGRQPSWIARPGEKLAPGQRNILDEYVKTAGGGGTAAALGAGIAGGMAGLGDESSEDDLAAVPGAKKFLRRLAMAQNPRFLEPLSNEKVAGAVKFNKSPQKDPLVWGAQRFENLADILPGRQQRRGMYYTLAEPRPTGQTWEPRGMYQHSFADLLKPGSEGGSRGVLGDVIVRNPLLLPGNSFYGTDAPRIIGGDPNKIRNYMRKGVASDIRGANSWEDLNKALPKKYRLNNTDIRNFKNDPNRPYSFNDTVGDLLISKFLKNEGYDAGIPRGVRKSISKFGPANVHQSEVVFPSESRWDLRPQFQPNWRTLETWARGEKALPPEVELSLLKRGIKPVESKAPAGGSKLEAFAKQMGVEVPQKPKKKFASIDDEILDTMGFNVDPDFAMLQQVETGAKPKMTKADRIAKWGNPGFKDPETGKVLFYLEDFFKYRLPDNSAVGKKISGNKLMQDYSSPVFQDLNNFGSFGGPKFYATFTDPTTVLALAKKGAKPLSGTYIPKKSEITKEQLDELKKFFKVLSFDD